MLLFLYIVYNKDHFEKYVLFLYSLQAWMYFLNIFWFRSLQVRTQYTDQCATIFTTRLAKRAKVMFSDCLFTGGGAVVQNFAIRCPSDLGGGTCSSEFCHQVSQWSVGGGGGRIFFPPKFFFQNFIFFSKNLFFFQFFFPTIFFRIWPGGGRSWYASCGHAGGLSCLSCQMKPQFLVLLLLLLTLSSSVFSGSSTVCIFCVLFCQ